MYYLIHKKMNKSLSAQGRRIWKLNHYDVEMSVMDIEDY